MLRGCGPKVVPAANGAAMGDGCSTLFADGGIVSEEVDDCRINVGVSTLGGLKNAVVA